MPQRDTILRLLAENRCSYVSGERLTTASGLSRAGVWKHIAALRRLGFVITAAIRKGYCLEHMPDRLLPPLIEALYPERSVVKKIYYFEHIDSTNRFARDRALQIAPEESLVITEEQRAGRGRMDRRWVSSAYSDILCSFILFPSVHAASVFRLTMLAALAVVDTIAAQCGLEPKIKWPNDIFLGRKKVCGILTEFLADHDGIHYLVIGIGLNVNSAMRDNPELSGTATSLADEAGSAVSRLHVMAALLKTFEQRYLSESWRQGESLKREWMRHSLIDNRCVTITSDDETVTGTARGITAEGHLLFEDEHGTFSEILCGDVSLKL